MLRWYGKDRNTSVDQHMKRELKDGKLAPSLYFQTGAKGLQGEQILPSSMFSTKRHLVSKLPKEGLDFISNIQKAEKKKQLGPAAYKVENIRAAQALTQDDLNGNYRGLAKCATEQMLMHSDAQAHGMDTP